MLAYAVVCITYEPLVITGIVALPREEWLAFRKTGIITAILIALKLAGIIQCGWWFAFMPLPVGTYASGNVANIICGEGLDSAVNRMQINDFRYKSASLYSSKAIDKLMTFDRRV